MSPDSFTPSIVIPCYREKNTIHTIMNSTENSQTLRRQKHLIGCQGERMRLLILALLLIVFIYRGYLLIDKLKPPAKLGRME